MPELSRRLLHPVHLFDFRSEAALRSASRFNLPFAVSSPFSMVNGSAEYEMPESACNAASSGFTASNAACTFSRVTLPVTIADRYPRPLPTNTTCCAPGRCCSNFFFNRLGRNIVSRPQNDQVLNPPDDAPVPCRIHFALIAGMKPAIAQTFGCFLRTVPVSRKNIRPAHDDLFILAQLHFDAADRGPDAPGLDVARIIHGADRRSFRSARKPASTGMPSIMK